MPRGHNNLRAILIAQVRKPASPSARPPATAHRAASQQQNNESFATGSQVVTVRSYLGDAAATSSPSWTTTPPSPGGNRSRSTHDPTSHAHFPSLAPTFRSHLRPQKATHPVQTVHREADRRGRALVYPMALAGVDIPERHPLPPSPYPSKMRSCSGVRNAPGGRRREWRVAGVVVLPLVAVGVDMAYVHR